MAGEVPGASRPDAAASGAAASGTAASGTAASGTAAPWTAATWSDTELIRLALELARRAVRTHDVPVGAVVLSPEGVVIGEGWNAREATNDPTAHAEVLALRAAALALGGWNLAGCTVAVTVEPCTMCAGAIVAARVDTLVFGCWEPKTGAAGSLWDVLRDRRLTHRVQVRPGVLADECAELLRAFFAAHRADHLPPRG
jgi:tRNA(adenine34) deaminase